MGENSREFFKVFLPTHSSQRLLIPPAFVKKHGRDMLIARKHILKDSTETLWNVDVEVVGNKLFIRDGWSDFVTDNSLEYGDFLVFSYSESSVFDVRLFGKNGCLKNNDSSTVEDVKPFSKDEDNSKSVQTSSRFPRACKRKSVKVVPSKTINDDSLDGPLSKSRRLGERNFETKKAMLPTKPLVRPKTPHTIVLMKKCYRYNMLIPSGPLRENEIELAETVVLRDHNDKLWPLKVNVTSDGRSFLSTGWSDFQKHMKLENKDQCLLEFLLEKGNFCKEMKVQVFYANPSKRKILGTSV